MKSITLSSNADISPAIEVVTDQNLEAIRSPQVLDRGAERSIKYSVLEANPCVHPLGTFFMLPGIIETTTSGSPLAPSGMLKQDNLWGLAKRNNRNLQAEKKRTDAETSEIASKSTRSCMKYLLAHGLGQSKSNRNQP